MKSTIFWDITPPAFTLVSLSAFFSNLKIEAMFLRNVGSLSTEYTALYRVSLINGIKMIQVVEEAKRSILR
jgi:hypothetical protein